MRKFNVFNKVILLSIITVIASCGGSSNSDGVTAVNSTTSNTNADGLWSGTITVSGLTFQVSAILFNSELHAFSIDGGEVYQGSFTTGDQTINASLRTSDLNGNLLGTATLSGTATEQGTIEATFSSTTGTSGNMSLVFNSASNNMPSLNNIQGNFIDNRLQVSATIDSQGNFTAQDTLGCDITGMATVIEGANIYRLTATAASNCAERAGNYEGVLNTILFSNANNGFTVVASNDNFIVFYVFEEQ